MISRLFSPWNYSVTKTRIPEGFHFETCNIFEEITRVHAVNPLSLHQVPAAGVAGRGKGIIPRTHNLRNT
jgi:hypothetical protein